MHFVMLYMFVKHHIYIKMHFVQDTDISLKEQSNRTTHCEFYIECIYLARCKVILMILVLQYISTYDMLDNHVPCIKLKVIVTDY